MSLILKLMLKAIWNRRMSVALAIITLSLSVALFLSVTRVQQAARDGFERSIAGVDLIVGARGSDIQILLYSVFRLGDATRDFRWSSYQEVQQNPQVAWTVPIALGDSHKGFRVAGTTNDYFKYIKYGDKRSLAFAEGGQMSDLFDVVLGAKVAQELGYKLGSRIVVAHGTVSTGRNAMHDDLPFVVSGILEPTGTAMDETLFISMEAVTAIHVGWESGRKLGESNADRLRATYAAGNLDPGQLTAAFVGLKSKLRLFRVQKSIQEYPNEALSAVLPGIALSRLWSIVGSAEQALRLVTGLIVIVAIMGMIAATVASLSERRREMAIFRSLGATPLVISSLLLVEAGLIAFSGCVVGLAVTQILAWLAADLAQARFGLQLSAMGLSWTDLAAMGGIILAALCAALIPAWLSYRQTLSDGLTVRS